MNLYRPEPNLPVHAYKTYTLSAPIKSHFRRATCAEADCIAYREGWTIPLAGIDPKLEYIARHSGKRFREAELAGGKYLVFEPGQDCFRMHDHFVSLEREPFYLVGRGDWRAKNSEFAARRWEREARQHANGEDWVDDFANHQDRINTVVERG